MSDISGSGSLQFWQGVAVAVGSGLGAFAVAIGRRAGALARRDAEPALGGEALQRQILAELKGLRADYAAAREQVEEERRTDARFDALERGQRIQRANTNDIKILLGETLRRLPESHAGHRHPRRDDVDPES